MQNLHKLYREEIELIAKATVVGILAQGPQKFTYRQLKDAIHLKAKTLRRFREEVKYYFTAQQLFIADVCSFLLDRWVTKTFDMEFGLSTYALNDAAWDLVDTDAAVMPCERSRNDPFMKL
jgi:hypothetical protein